MDKWLSDALMGVGLVFLAAVGSFLLAADGALPILGAALVILAAPLALVFLVADGVRLGRS